MNHKSKFCRNIILFLTNWLGGNAKMRSATIKRKRLNVHLDYVAKSESESHLAYLTLTLTVLVTSKKVTKTFLKFQLMFDNLIFDKYF